MNLGAIVAEEWERATTLGDYGHDPMTVGYWRSQAFVRLWSWRKGDMEWRRFPSRDVSDGKEPQPRRSPFDSSWLYEALLL